MRVFRDWEKIKKYLMHGAVVSMGNYDGVHLGHQQVLGAMLKEARVLNLPSVVICFDPLPEEFFGFQSCMRLTTVSEKLRIFREAGVDFVLCLRFNARLANMTAAEFVDVILVKALAAKKIIVGDDFVFGKKGKGDFVFLSEVSEHYGFYVKLINSCKIHGVRISSSITRAAVEQGDFSSAKKMLGREYSITGKIVSGKKLGRVLGFPTANLQKLRGKLLPLGVYVVKVILEERVFWGVANIGLENSARAQKKLVEVYLFDFSEDIYGKILKIKLLHKIRDEIKFVSLEDLVAQIKADIEEARNFLNLSRFTIMPGHKS